MPTSASKQTKKKRGGGSASASPGSKSCPPGVFCIENATIVFMIVLVFLGWFFFSNENNGSHNNSTRMGAIGTSGKNKYAGGSGSAQFAYVNRNDPINTSRNTGAPLLTWLGLRSDIESRYANTAWSGAGYPALSNPALPLNPAIAATAMRNPGVLSAAPIITNTGALSVPYERVGLLTATNNKGPNSLLSLMGRPLNANGVKWQYYTISDQLNAVRMPITVNGKSAASEYGVNELLNGDTVYVDGANGVYAVTMYETSSLRYMPF